MTCQPFSSNGAVGIACGLPEPEEFDRDRVIAVGFGGAYVTRDGVEVLDGEAACHRGEEVTGADAEALAAADPDHVWEIVIVGAMSGATYTRTAEGKWIATRHDEGFA